MNNSNNTNSRKINKLQIIEIGNTPFIPESERENINWVAKHYREKSNALYNSASVSTDEMDYAVTFRSTKKAHLAAVERANKVRHNGRQPSWTPSKYIMIGNVPHKMVDGNLVPLVNRAQEELATEIHKQICKLAGVKASK
jgi:hypothetical protein